MRFVMLLILLFQQLQLLIKQAKISFLPTFFREMLNVAGPIIAPTNSSNNNNKDMTIGVTDSKGMCYY